MFVFENERSPKELLSATAIAKFKRKRGKKVIRPTFSNNPFQVYSIYFTRRKSGVFRVTFVLRKPIGRQESWNETEAMGKGLHCLPEQQAKG